MVWNVSNIQIFQRISTKNGQFSQTVKITVVKNVEKIQIKVRIGAKTNFGQNHPFAKIKIKFHFFIKSHQKCHKMVLL
jgi:hypothetical protein